MRRGIKQPGARRARVAAMLWLGVVGPAIAAVSHAELRVAAAQRCGDLLAAEAITYCLVVDGSGGASKAESDGDSPRGDISSRSDTALQATLNGKSIPASALVRDGNRVRLSFDPAAWRSGPLRLQLGPMRSNPVWLSMGRSHVLAATPDRVVRNADGLDTYLDLVAVLIEEDQDGRREASRLAKKYGAEVVGAIPPLNIYQLRLPAANLLERDALILRLGHELTVDAVIVEESGPEQPIEGDRSQPGAALEEWTANRFIDGVHFYRRRLKASPAPEPVLIRIGVVERAVDFDASDFGDLLDCDHAARRVCVYASDAPAADGHGSTVAGILAASWDAAGNTGFLRGLDGASGGFEVIVNRNSDGGILANVAASVNMVEDGVRLLNWSWGLHRLGATDVQGDEVDSLVRSGLAMSGYEELLEEFFRWLRAEHPAVLVVNSAGNGSAWSGQDEYRLPSSFITDQLLVVGAHQRAFDRARAVADPRYAEKRDSSNIDARVDITAAACSRASSAAADQHAELHCGTSYATAMVTGVVAAMLSINPELQPAQLRELLRRSALPIGSNSDFEPLDAEDLTAPILPSERGFELGHSDVGYSARLDIRAALELALESLDTPR